jgi:hypothetical protein
LFTRVIDDHLRDRGEYGYDGAPGGSTDMTAQYPRAREIGERRVRVSRAEALGLLDPIESPG